MLRNQNLRYGSESRSRTWTVVRLSYSLAGPGPALLVARYSGTRLGVHTLPPPVLNQGDQGGNLIPPSLILIPDGDGDRGVRRGALPAGASSAGPAAAGSKGPFKGEVGTS